MTQTPAFAHISKWQLFGIIFGSIVRAALGIAVILWALSLVPEQVDGSIALPIVVLCIGIVVYIYIFRRQIHKIQHARFPSLRAIEAMVLIAAAFLAVFAAVYVMQSASNAASFTEPLDHFTAFYFALTVLATVGFGDITPVSDGARLACMLQMAIDIGFIAVMLKVVSSTAQKSILARKSSKPDSESTQS
ncbi:MAG: potassium channel family protein [Candidatus Nanopelagicales bacterium]|nr:potassium channel family protein [Candidatus Nanopelagicales bacterium]